MPNHTKSNSMIIRAMQQSDLVSVAEIYNHYILHTHINFETIPYDDVYIQHWFLQFNKDSKYRAFVALEDNQILGFAVSQDFKDKPAYQTSVEVTVYLTKNATGKGLGEKLSQILLDKLRQYDVKRAYANIALPNDASINLHQKLGFKQVAYLSEVGRKFDQYYDVAMLEYKF